MLALLEISAAHILMPATLIYNNKNHNSLLSWLGLQRMIHPLEHSLCCQWCNEE
jgi:hypothetical protein